MYKKFTDATGHREPPFWHTPILPENEPTHPVVGVAWHDAMAYAKWAGGRLPTESEWEYAARGGLSDKRYPWGNRMNHDDANYEGIGGKDEWRFTAPVRSFAANGYGLYDMAGSVWEWCLDEDDRDFYAKSSRNNPVAGGTIELIVENFVGVSIDRVARGGSWTDGASSMRVAGRKGLGISDKDKFHATLSRSVGFRYALPLKSELSEE